MKNTNPYELHPYDLDKKLIEEVQFYMTRQNLEKKLKQLSGWINKEY